MPLFGTDGIRGIANREPMTSETITRVGRALAYLTRLHSSQPGILIGKDTRLSGYMIETALATGICSMGVDLFLVGPLPTSGIAWLTKVMQLSRGVAVTASHNPYQDNGLKVFDRDGFKIPKEEEQEIDDLVVGKKIDALRPTEERVGKAHRVDEAQQSYIQHLCQTFPQPLNLEGLSLVLDCANGAAYAVAPQVLTKLGAKVKTLGVEPNGRNINEACGSEHPETLQKAVLETVADVGIALDGDADRCVMVDEKGHILDGDHLMALVALHRLKEEKLNHRTVVITEMSNTGFVHFLEKNGIKTVEVPVGDQNVSAALRKGGLSFGGEQSGHILFPEFTTTVDGMITALQVLAVMRAEQKTLCAMAHPFEPWPQVLRNIPVTQKPPLETLPELSRQVRRCEEEIDGHGRIIIRYSGTQNLLRIMIEGEDGERIQAMAEELERYVFCLINN